MRSPSFPKPHLQHLWRMAPPAATRFQPADIAHLPAPVQRYLKRAIAPNTPLASAVHLRMRGEIKLKTWVPFWAEQVIGWPQGFVWQATAWMGGLPIFGADWLLDGVGGMRWKLLGLFPVMEAAGEDINRAAVGRIFGECMWLPSVFCQPTVTWSATDDTHIHAQLSLYGESTTLHITLTEAGQLQRITYPRWGNPDGAAYGYVDFGGYLEGEGTFQGYTIPTQVRIGWYAEGDRFVSEGDFFHAQVQSAVYR